MSTRSNDKNPIDCNNWSFESLSTLGSVELGLSTLKGVGGESVEVAVGGALSSTVGVALSSTGEKGAVVESLDFWLLFVCDVAFAVEGSVNGVFALDMGIVVGSSEDV